jgi:hypothetical protein
VTHRASKREAVKRIEEITKAADEYEKAVDKLSKLGEHGMIFADGFRQRQRALKSSPPKGRRRPRPSPPTNAIAPGGPDEQNCGSKIDRDPKFAAEINRDKGVV